MLRRLLVVLAILILLSPILFIGLYRIAAKKALTGTALRTQINKHPKGFRIDWDEAQSTWPGRVTVKNLSIRGSDPNVEWIVILPEASFRYSVWALLSRRFLVTGLRPKSIQFRIRQKLPPKEATPKRVQFLPPIPGFDDPPLRVEGETLPPPESNPFTIEVFDVATDAFNDIWFDGFRYQGPGTLRGRFGLKPGFRAQIGPASVTFGGGALTANEKPAVTKLEGKLEATFEDWDVQELTEDKVWRVVTAKAQLAGPTPGVDFLDALLALGPGVHVSGGPGQASLTGALEHGVASGSVSLTAKAGKYTRPRLTLEGNADVLLKFSNWNLDGGSPNVGGTTLKVNEVIVAGSGAREKGWWGDFSVPSGRLAKGKGLTGKISLKCKDGRPLLAFLGAALPKWTRGLVDLESLAVTADVVLSDPRTSAHAIHGEGGHFTIEGEYDRRGERQRGAFLIETGILIVGVELDNEKTIVRPLLAKQWFAKARPTY